MPRQPPPPHRRAPADADTRPRAGRSRDRPRDDGGQGRPGQPRRPAAGSRPERLRARRQRAGTAGRSRIRAPGGRRSSARSARCMSTTPRSSPSASTGMVRRLAAIDARGEATRPAITFLDARATAESDELGRSHRRSRLGPRRPARRAVGRAPRARRRDGHVLVSVDVGVARLPPDGDRDRPARARPGRRGSGPRRGRRRADRPAAASVGHGRDRRRTRQPALPRRSACGPGSRSSGAPSTRSRATSAPGSWRRAMPTTRADRPAGSASTGTARSRSPAAS